MEESHNKKILFYFIFIFATEKKEEKKYLFFRNRKKKRNRNQRPRSLAEKCMSNLLSPSYRLQNSCAYITWMHHSYITNCKALFTIRIYISYLLHY